MDTCQWCGQQLVEVDNPMRREMRHKRGEEANCPGPPNAVSSAPINYASKDTGWAAALAAEPQALAACPQCAGTWWGLGRQVRIGVADYLRSVGGTEPVHQEHRTTISCAKCGYSPPGT